MSVLHCNGSTVMVNSAPRLFAKQLSVSVAYFCHHPATTVCFISKLIKKKKLKI